MRYNSKVHYDIVHRLSVKVSFLYTFECSIVSKYAHYNILYRISVEFCFYTLLNEMVFQNIHDTVHKLSTVIFVFT